MKEAEKNSHREIRTALATILGIIVIGPAVADGRPGRGLDSIAVISQVYTVGARRIDCRP